MHAQQHLSVVTEELHGFSRNQLNQNFLECRGSYWTTRDHRGLLPSNPEAYAIHGEAVAVKATTNLERDKGHKTKMAQGQRDTKPHPEPQF